MRPAVGVRWGGGFIQAWHLSPLTLVQTNRRLTLQETVTIPRKGLSGILGTRKSLMRCQPCGLASLRQSWVLGKNLCFVRVCWEWPDSSER